MTITKGDLDDIRIVDLLRVHVESARAETAPGSAHVLDSGGLRSPDIDFWAIWDGEDLVAIGAMKRLSSDHGEVKSMHVASARRRSGAGGAMVRHIISTAKAQGMSRLSLETGSWAYFQPARELYRKHGFVEGPPFSDYREDPNSVFMHVALDAISGGTGTPLDQS